MMVSDEKYQKHGVFDDLTRYSNFYDTLGHSVFPFVSVGTKSLGNIDSYLFSSIQGTLLSIQTILRDGRINDAYALLRKYYDSAIIHVYTGLYLEDNVSIQNFIVEKIDNWLKGKEQLPEYRVMSQYIRNTARVTPITSLLHADDRYKLLRNRCNNHTHYNFYKNVLLNDGEIFLKDRLKVLQQFSNDLRDIVILHLSYIFFEKPHYMMASDHVDYLECGSKPPADSEYWVAPFVQEIFDATVKKHRPDIAAAIKQSTNMHLA